MSKIDRIEFKTTKTADRLYSSIEIFINGVNLINLLGAVEEPFAIAEGHPDIAGSYTGLPARDVDEIR